jgi:hypothetical protein
MKMRDMSTEALITKFEITLTIDGERINIPHGQSLYPAAIAILKSRKDEIMNYLLDEEEDGFGRGRMGY